MSRYFLRQSASATLVFVLFVIPILMLLSVLSLGVADYLNVNQSQQKQLDQAVLLGATQLQNPLRAVAGIREFLSKSTRHASGVRINASQEQGSVAVELNTKSNFNLANYFGIDSQADLRLRSAARLRPQNVTILFDNSAYLAPDPFVRDQDFESGFTAAQFIENNFTDFSYNRFARSPEQLTASCFNPSLLKLKLSAIELVSYFRVFSSDFNVLAAPSAVVAVNSDSRLDQIISFQDKQSSTVSFQASSYCAGAAEHENYQFDYRFPKRSNQTEGIIDYTDGSYKAGYDPYLLPEEVIWSRASNYHQLNLNLESVLNQIIQGGFLRLTEHKNNKLIFLLGDLPRSAGLLYPNPDVVNRVRNKLIEISEHTKANQRRLNIYFLFIPYGDNYNRVKDSYQEWEGLLSEIDALGATLKLRSFLYDNDRNLTKNIQEIARDEQLATLSY